MEIINPNMTAGDKVRICSTDVLAPSHMYGEGGGNIPPIPCYAPSND